MKLLIITQKVDKNDPVLGFFHRWLEEFAKHCDKLTVICLEMGQYDLPKNVKVLSLGKEDGVSRFKYIKRFYKYIHNEQDNYDSVFVHMNPEYVVLGGIAWKTWKKKIALWYTHRNVDLKLRIAEKFADVIFTASKESFNLPTEKLRVMGHGIPVEDFKNPEESRDAISVEKLRIISVGRITPIKNLDTLIEAVKILKDKKIDLEVKLIGSPVQKGDKEYLQKLKEMVSTFGLEKVISFEGSVPNSEIKKEYWQSDISINLCPTGGVDKAVLESMAAGLIVLASNRTFKDYFGKYGERLLFKERDAEDLADKIVALKEGNDLEDISNFLLGKVGEKAGLETLINNILNEL